MRFGSGLESLRLENSWQSSEQAAAAEERRQDRAAENHADRSTDDRMNAVDDPYKEPATFRKV